MHRDKREEETKKEAGEGWRGPILRLIESSFGTADTSLKNEVVFCKEQTKKRPACCSYSITTQRNPRSVFAFIATTEHPSASLKEAGHKCVIYDNCFLSFSKV